MNDRSPLLLTIYGDSLSMPRSFDGVSCDQVYSELLRRESQAFGVNSCVVFNRSEGGTRIQDLFHRFQHDLSYIADDKNKILIIQCGIVDCAPRPIPFLLKRLIGAFPGGVRKSIIDFLHQNRAGLLKVFRFRLTSPRRFGSILRRWLLMAGPEFKKIYVVNIFPTTDELEAHSPGLRESIDRYNQIIERTIQDAGNVSARLVDVFGEIARSGESIGRFVSQKDGHHLTLNGHELIKKIIVSIYEK